jgi:hypothetical protein
VLAEKQGNTGDHSHAVSKGRKRKSRRPAARDAQPDNGPVGRFVGGRRRGDCAKAIELAKAGEIAALRMCLDRLAPVRKDEPVVFDLPALDTAADSVAAAARIVAGVADGDLTPSEAMDLAKVIDVYVAALATKAFEERLAKLESAANR